MGRRSCRLPLVRPAALRYREEVKTVPASIHLHNAMLDRFGMSVASLPAHLLDGFFDLCDRYPHRMASAAKVTAWKMERWLGRRLKA